MRRVELAVCNLLLVLGCSYGAEFRVNDFGAKGDGKTVNTAAVQKAIDAAAKARGTIVFAPGVYLTGSLFLKSGTHLRLDKGVEIRGVQQQSAYPVMKTRVAGVEMEWPSALINVYEQSDVKISGAGVIDGNGKMWWDAYWKLRKEYEPKGLRWASDYDCQRPRLIQVYKATNIAIEGLTLRRSGFWTVHICYSTKVTVDGLTIRNNIGGVGPSTDGIDIDSSSDVLVQNADIECNDDAVVLKAGRDADGLRVNRPTENVVVRDITVRKGTAGITFGSETSGGIRHVEAYRIHVLPSVTYGIFFKSAQTRGGTVEDISIHDVDVDGVKTAFRITFNWYPNYSYARIPEGMTNVPAYWRVLAQPVPKEKGFPHLRNVRISNLTVKSAQEAFSVAGYKEAPLREVSFRDSNIRAQRAGTIENAEDWLFTNTRVQTTDQSRVMLKDSRGISGLSSVTFRFDFDLGEDAEGYTKVPPGTAYDEKLGYGFEDPCHFSVRVPEEGNYRVVAMVGDRQAEAVTTIKAELRRLMVENAATLEGDSTPYIFLVNVRTPRIAGGSAVTLNDREKSYEAWAWDDKLTLEFSGPKPAVRAIEIEKADDVPTLYIAGDSTSTDQPKEPFSSWGQVLPRFFRPEIAIANHGESGMSLRRFIAEHRLAKLMSVTRAGDFLLIQMGHNDQKEKDGGAFTTYRADLKRFIFEARERGATPILVTSMNRLTFAPDGTITDSLGDYPEAVRQTAREEGVAVIDLNAMSKTLYEALGQDDAPKAFVPGDRTHHSAYGSYELARCIVEAIRQQRLPLAKYLIDMPPFDPAHPDTPESYFAAR